jgi:hypothetical protein
MDLNMLNKAFLLLTLLIPTNSYAGEGTFTLVPKGGIVPFQATCFDDFATATIIADNENKERQFKIEIENVVNVAKIECDQRLELQTVMAEAEKQRLLVSVESKQKQIDDLTHKLSRLEKRNIPLFVTAGIVAGFIIGGGITFSIATAVGN